MFFIAERINGMFRDVAKAIKDKDEKVIQELAQKQVAAGAKALDVNVGPESEDHLKDMLWLIDCIQKTTDTRLAIDTTKIDVMDAGLAKCKNKPILNSISGVMAKATQLVPLAKKYNSSIIALTMDEKGIPQDADGRMAIAANILALLMENEIELTEVYMDAVILPVNVAQVHGKEVLETIKQIKSLADPPPKTILGLSNVSQGTKIRPLINRTYLAMAIAAGLDGAILDVLDKDLVDAGITAELLLDKQIYCESFLDAYRKQ